MVDLKVPGVDDVENGPAWHRLAARVRTPPEARVSVEPVAFTRADMIRAFRVGGAEVAVDCNADGATATIPWSDEEISKILKL